MKSTIIFSVLLSSSLCFTSCKKEEEAAVTTSDAPTQIVDPNLQNTTNNNFGQQQAVQNVAPAPEQINVAGVQPQTAIAAKPGMNPAHGQPGHRCDISVGAPLNSPPGKNPASAGSTTAQKTDNFTITPATTTTTQTSQPSSAPAILSSDTPVATAPGMNPPHGQPGHQCGVAVGAPLPKS